MELFRRFSVLPLLAMATAVAAGGPPPAGPAAGRLGPDCSGFALVVPSDPLPGVRARCQQLCKTTPDCLEGNTISQDREEARRTLCVLSVRERGAAPMLPGAPSVASMLLVDMHRAPANEVEANVAEVVSDIAEIALFGRGRLSGRVDVQIGTRSGHGSLPLFISDATGLDIRASYRMFPSILRSDSYVVAASAVLAGLGIPAQAGPPATDDGKLLDRLTDFQLGVIAREARRVSGALAERPLDPDLHEQAAMCLAALALKESAGLFQDPREPARRALAHLAIARAMRTSRALGVVGGVAEAVLSATTQRGASARGHLDALGDAAALPSGFAAWANAIRIASDGDWRTLEKPLASTLLERSLHYRALRNRIGDLKALDFVTSRNTLQISEWSRSGLKPKASVEGGNVLTQLALALEFKEVTEVAKVHDKRVDESTKLGALLGPSGGRCLTETAPGAWQPEVIGWGIWSGHFQRHLMHASLATYVHRAYALGRPEAARSFRELLPQAIGGLEQFPMLAGRLAWESSRETENDKRKPAERDPDAIRAARLFALANRLKVPAEQWFLVVDDRSGLARDPGQIAFNDWFGIDRQRAFTAGFFTRYLSNVMDGPEVERLLAENPHDVLVLEARSKSLHGTAELTIRQFDDLYASTAAFDVALMRRRAKLLESVPSLYTQQIRRIAEFYPNELVEAGKYLAERNIEEQAAQLFARAVETARDDVALSHHCSWYIDYLWRHDRKDDARELVRRFARTYSAPGLFEMALQYERDGNLQRAEEYYKKYDERYAKDERSRSFYFRHRDRYREQGAVAAQELFPDGVRTISLDGGPGEPERGLYIGAGGIAFTSRGVPPKAIVAGVDGIAVTTWDQYRALRQEPKGLRRLLLWNDGSWREVDIAIPGDDWDVHIGEHKRR